MEVDHTINGRALNGRALNGRALNGRALNGRALNGRAHLRPGCEQRVGSLFRTETSAFITMRLSEKGFYAK